MKSDSAAVTANKRLGHGKGGNSEQFFFVEFPSRSDLEKKNLLGFKIGNYTTQTGIFLLLFNFGSLSPSDICNI